VFFERRQNLRVRPAAVEPIKVQFVAAGMLAILYAVDISEGGIALRLEARMDSNAVGMTVELVVSLPSLPPVYLKGVIRRVGYESGYVVGISFVDPSDKASEAIRTYIERRSAARAARAG
jgi:hypothetical protein